MSKLSDFYAHRNEMLKEKGLFEIEQKWETLEEKLLREELLPAIGNALKPLLKDVKTPLSINMNYMPDGTLAMSFTRNSLIMTMTDNTEQEATKEAYTPSPVETGMVEEPMPTEAEDTQTAVEEEKPTDYAIATFPDGTTTNLPKKTLKRYRVVFPDGTVFDEGEGKSTLIKALRKFGLKRICKEAQHVEHSGYKLVGTIPFRDNNGNIDKSKQDFIDGYYVFKNTDTPDKIMDILKIGRRFGIRVKVYSYEGVNLTDVVSIKDAPKKTYEKKTVAPNGLDTPLPQNATMKDRFEKWLYGKMSASGAKTYLSTLNNAVKAEINKYVDSTADSVFSFTSLDEMLTCVELLEANDDFIALDKEKHHALTAPIKKWMEFLQDYGRQMNHPNEY